MPAISRKNGRIRYTVILFLYMYLCLSVCDAWSISLVADHYLSKARDHRIGSGGLVCLSAVEPTIDQSVLNISTASTRAKGEENEVEENPWNKAFERLKSFHQNHGHSHVPYHFDDGKRPVLGLWVSGQRKNYRKGLLSEEKIQKLRSLGFAWQVNSKQFSDQLTDEESWHSAFRRLLPFKQKFGHLNVPHNYDDGGSPLLGKWVVNQRRYYNAQEKIPSMYRAFSPEKIALLEEIGFEWEYPLHDQMNDRWNEKFEKLKAFTSKYNSTKMTDPPYGCEDPLAELVHWTRRQTTEYSRFMANKTTCMTQDKVERMESIGFSWTFKKETDYEWWLHEYFQVYFHFSEFKNTNISSSNGHNSRLMNWVVKQKKDYRDGKLDQGKIDLLNEIDFDWRVESPDTWDEMYQELCEYHEKHNSTLFNVRINGELAEWARKQRKLYSKGNLDLDKTVKLNSLGFQWDVRDENWNAMCDRLETFKRKRNSVLVPNFFAEDPPLGRWVYGQRLTYSRYLVDTMTFNDTLLRSTAEKLATRILPAQVHKARLMRLCSLDFVWNINEAEWTENYEKLVKFKEHNNSTLTLDNCADRQLRNWVAKQRQNKHELSEKRRSLLDAVGFVWDPLEERWQDLFERLCAYKDEFGDCIVPTRYQNDRELGQWVYGQRDAYRWRVISEERIAKLNSIGFHWTIREYPEPH